MPLPSFFTNFGNSSPNDVVDGSAGDAEAQGAQTSIPKANTTVSLKEFLQSPEYLFDMTARNHGKSASTTSQDKRPSISSTWKRPQEEAEPSAGTNGDGDASRGATATKKAKSEAKGQTKGGQGEGEDDQETCSTNQERTFKMTRWEPSDFYSFLKKADVEFDKIQVQTDTDSAADYLECMKRSMRPISTSKEEAVQHEVECRVYHLSSILSSTPGVLGESFLGRKSMAPKPPPSVGADTQVDFIFTNDRNGEKYRKIKPLEGTGIVPWEKKVSWKFPGGSTTSPRFDYARLGRDVKLYDFLPSRRTVDSLADEPKDAKPGKEAMLNPREGEDKQLITSLPAPAIASIATAEGGEANSLNPANSNVAGKYEMHHDVFPVRQIVSYMLSYRTRYGILSTGYRFDFIKLVVDPYENLEVQIAGPLWAVGKLNERAVNPKDNESAYYKSIHRYGTEGTVSILDETWSTKIGDYPFMEGLVRFCLAATGMDTQEDTCDGADSSSRKVQSTQSKAKSQSTGMTREKTSQGHKPRSHMTTMPSWCGKFARSAKTRRPGPKDVTDTEYSALCEGNQNFSFKDNNEMKDYVSMMKREYKCDWSEAAKDPKWGAGLTKFGPLTLAELESSNELIGIGSGRIGEAFRADLPDIKLACKLLRRSEWGDKPYQKRVQELMDEMETYWKLRECQGVCIPRFLFAGHITEASYWIIPEHGEMIAFATTYEGICLPEYNLIDPNFCLEEDVRSQARLDLKMIHDKDIVHCDLVPRNLVYDNQSNRIKFIDFGNALSKTDCESADSSWQEYCDKDVAMLENSLSEIPHPPNDPGQECSPTRSP